MNKKSVKKKSVKKSKQQQKIDDQDKKIDDQASQIEAIKNNIPLDKLEHFYEVAELINDLVTNKKIYNQNESRLKYNE